MPTKGPAVSKLAPELAPVLARMQPWDVLADVPATRARLRAVLATAPPPRDPRMVVQDTVVDGPDFHQIPVRVYTPTRRAAPHPALVYLHGGAFVSGDLDTDDANCRDLCAGAGAVVVSVDYRLAPEHPFPAGIEDCYAALVWLRDHADNLNVDPARLAVAGRSAGGCLAAGLTMLARERGGPELAYQLLLVPALDNRADTPSAYAITDPRVINRKTVLDMWPAYLGDADETILAAVPGRARDLSGLPPACVLTCELDPLRDEGIDYTRRLIAAGVSTELHLIPGAFHLFEGFAPDSELARRTTEIWVRATELALVRSGEHRSSVRANN
jgi:acetyl esterase/lipase